MPTITSPRCSHSLVIYQLWQPIFILPSRGLNTCNIRRSFNATLFQQLYPWNFQLSWILQLDCNNFFSSSVLSFNLSHAMISPSLNKCPNHTRRVISVFADWGPAPLNKLGMSNSRVSAALRLNHLTISQIGGSKNWISWEGEAMAKHLVSDRDLSRLSLHLQSCQLWLRDFSFEVNNLTTKKGSLD